MKYEFHVGDYVETKGDSFGYINGIDDDGVTWYCVHDADGCRAGYDYYVVGIKGDKLSQYYNRIGQYNFTKPEQPKEIERLDDTSALKFRGKFVFEREVDGDEDEESNLHKVYMSYKLFDKINELVDAVNELRAE